MLPEWEPKLPKIQAIVLQIKNKPWTVGKRGINCRKITQNGNFNCRNFGILTNLPEWEPKLPKMQAILCIFGSFGSHFGILFGILYPVFQGFKNLKIFEPQILGLSTVLIFGVKYTIDYRPPRCKKCSIL